MTALARHLGSVAIALGTALAIGAVSRAPYTADRTEYGIMRLAWRARGERVEECRRLTPEELEHVPPHMRQEERCEGRILPYRLQVRIDGANVVDERVRAAGARHDRPLYVFEELPLVPGRHTVAVAFAREGTIPPGAREEPEETPALLALDTTVVVPSRRVLLVTYDDDVRRLVLRDRAP